MLLAEGKNKQTCIWPKAKFFLLICFKPKSIFYYKYVIIFEIFYWPNDIFYKYVIGRMQKNMFLAKGSFLTNIYLTEGRFLLQICNWLKGNFLLKLYLNFCFTNM